MNFSKSIFVKKGKTDNRRNWKVADPDAVCKIRSDPDPGFKKWSDLDLV